MTTAQNLLAITDYSISRYKEKKRINGLDAHVDRLNEEAPEFINQEIEGFKIVGKTSSFQQYIATKDDSYFAINIRRNVGATATNKAITQSKDLSKIVVTTKKLRDSNFDLSDFIPMASGTALDHCFSGDADHPDGGILPATNYIVIGDPGIGKSSVTIEYAASIQELNPDKKVLFISGEMTEMDLYPYTKRFPKWLDLDILYVSDLTEGLYKESIETKLQEGYDLVLGDSFAEIADAIRGDYNETVSGSNKKSYNDIEKWLVDLMVKNNKGENDSSLKTAFIMIQQMTKGNTFVGSNKLKHNTTGMIELRYTKSGDRKIVVSKNRRGNTYDNLHFTFSNDSLKPIDYDTDRILRDKRVEEEIRKAASEQLDDEKATDEWFNSLSSSNEEIED